MSRQGNPSNAIFYSTHTLKDKPRYTGLHPLILLGPNTPYEVSYVLKVVRFYRKLMVRNVTTKIMLPRRTSHYWGCWMGSTIDINRISLRRPIHIINPVNTTKLSCNTLPWRSRIVSLELTPFIHLFYRRFHQSVDTCHKNIFWLRANLTCLVTKHLKFERCLSKFYQNGRKNGWRGLFWGNWSRPVEACFLFS